MRISALGFSAETAPHLKVRPETPSALCVKLSNTYFFTYNDSICHAKCGDDVKRGEITRSCATRLLPIATCERAGRPSGPCGVHRKVRATAAERADPRHPAVPMCPAPPALAVQCTALHCCCYSAACVPVPASPLCVSRQTPTFSQEPATLLIPPHQ
jgi:hypothetical protein